RAVLALQHEVVIAGGQALVPVEGHADVARAAGFALPDALELLGAERAGTRLAGLEREAPAYHRAARRLREGEREAVRRVGLPEHGDRRGDLPPCARACLGECLLDVRSVLEHAHRLQEGALRGLG